MKTMIPMTKRPTTGAGGEARSKKRQSQNAPVSPRSVLSGFRSRLLFFFLRFGISSLISVIESLRKRKDSETREHEAGCLLVYIPVPYIANLNSCPHTIWPQLKAFENNKTIAAFELPPGNTRSIEILADFHGDLYSRTDCQSNNASSCKITKESMTMVTFKLQVNGTDEYYVDNIDGFNLPVSVDAIGGSGSGVYRCAKAGCIGQMKGWCPPELKVQGGDGCRSACNVFHTPEYCCSLSFSTPSTCKPTSYAKAFQRVCPRSRTLPYNTDNSTSIFTCEGADYIVRFCPAAGTFSTIQVGGQLRCTDRLTSTNGTFTLGFYGVHFGSLGIWYSNDENNKVWVAEPILSTSGNHVLSIDPNTGSLIIIAGGSTLRVIADVQTGPSSNVMATLGEDGRLRLIANATVLWQTPFHPFIQHGKTHTWVVLLVAVACGLLLLLVIILSYFFCKKINPPQQGDEETEMKEMVLLWSNFRFFDHESLSLATNHFSDENKIGRGGFGTVYKGTLGSGEEIAVKKLGRTSRQGRPEFNAEIKAIANAKHTSLVQVRGCCIHGSNLMLVYEYMHNKSVAYHLADEERRRALDWQTRKRIILAVAKGLRYLHMDSNMHVIHRDIKCNNILLDQNMNAKISDFGMARLLSLDETTARSQTIAGTFGYMAPECVRGGISAKCDLYSFGVVMLELVSGLRVASRSFPDNNGSLFSYALRLWGQGELYRLKDPLMMEDDHVRNELSRILRISILCIQTKPDDRPNASTICELLTNDMPVPEPVSHRHLQFLMTPPSSSQDITESCVHTIEVGDHRIS